jgi:DNA-binding Lrp family transcriptional regulator
MQTNEAKLNDLERRLLNDYQHDFPLSPTPYADIAQTLSVSEAEVLATLTHLQQQGAVSRVGAVLRPNTVGVSTLAAMAVPAERLIEVAQLVNGYAEVNHNYEREHRLNLWFVATAPDSARLQAVLNEIADRSGLEMLVFPLIEDYHIDLGFDLKI